MKIFISYRRDDSADICGRIYDRLKRDFEPNELFRDIESIPLGEDFRLHLQNAVTACDVVLVVVGPHWVNITDANGALRLDDERDYVRIEVETALQREIPTIPLLVAGARVPSPEQLPSSIQSLAFRNGAAVRPDPDFHNDMDRVISRLRSIVGSSHSQKVVDVKESTKDAQPEYAQTRNAEDGMKLSENSEMQDFFDQLTLKSPKSNEDHATKNVKFLEGQTVGIDLGTTFSAVAQLDTEGNPNLLTNVDDRSITPSIVLFGDNSEVLVGPTSERLSIEAPHNVVESIKRQMGNKDYYVVYQNRKLPPEFISALILKKLKQDAESHVGPVANAVITVPYYFNDVRRKATQDAGRIAGLNVIDIINEPTAAMLAYAWNRGDLGSDKSNMKERTVLVYDLGGGTFDVTVGAYQGSSFRVLATDGDVMLGGLDWTSRIVDHVSDQFERKFEMDPRDDPETLMRLSEDCENAKRKLSEESCVPVNVCHNGKTLTVSVSREEFERMTADLLARSRDTTELVLLQSGIKPEDLNDVVLVGGSTYMPGVTRMLKEVCKREPNCEMAPEAAVSQGAAIHAAILEAREFGNASRMTQTIIQRLRAIKTSDVNSHSLGVKVTDPKDKSRKLNHVMIPKNTTIPANVTQKFITTSLNQRQIHVCILEGEARDPDACSVIGDFRVTNLPPNLPIGSPVEVTYSYNANGRIHASAVEKSSGQQSETEIVHDCVVGEDELGAFRSLAIEYRVE